MSALYPQVLLHKNSNNLLVKHLSFWRDINVNAFFYFFFKDDLRSKTVLLVLKVGNANSHPSYFEPNETAFLGVIQMDYDNISRENICKRNKDALKTLKDLLQTN